MYFEQTHFRYVAIFSIVIILLISVSKPDLWSVDQSTQAQVSEDKVFVMYAAFADKDIRRHIRTSISK